MYPRAMHKDTSGWDSGFRWGFIAGIIAFTIGGLVATALVR